MNNSEEDKEVVLGKMEELHSTQTEEFPAAAAALAELAVRRHNTLTAADPISALELPKIWMQ